MKANRPSEHSWNRLARLAAQAPADSANLPFGFSSRVVAAWKADHREASLAAFEWLTVRGLGIALLIFAGSAAFAYDSVSDVFAGGASLVGGWLDVLPLPL